MCWQSFLTIWAEGDERNVGCPPSVVIEIVASHITPLEQKITGRIQKTKICLSSFCLRDDTIEAARIIKRLLTLSQPENTIQSTEYKGISEKDKPQPVLLFLIQHIQYSREEPTGSTKNNQHNEKKYYLLFAHTGIVSWVSLLTHITYFTYKYLSYLHV